ncbi:hypothetical protein HJC23_003746 [Cyclotella cryptica]|uniref:Uncharacterized protein n=1 Tax=Cyclotella cryptica TaxID=29204 RepID=A0ABD3QU58_9STRA
MSTVQDPPVEASPSAPTESPATPAANAQRAPEPVVTAASASFDQEDFDPPAAAAPCSALKRKRVSQQRDLPSGGDAGESRSQTVHRIAEGEKTYSEALLLASLSDEVDASAASAEDGAASSAAKTTPQPVTPKDQSSVVTTAETPRRSNVQSQMSSSADKPFVLHPKPSPSAHARDEPGQPLKRYKEGGGGGAVDTAIKKVTPDRRSDDGKREETHAASPSSARPTPAGYPPASQGWNGGPPTPSSRYPHTHPTHHYPCPYPVPSAYPAPAATHHGYYPRSPYPYPPSQYSPYPHPHTATDPYRDYRDTSLSSQPTPGLSTNSNNLSEQRDPASTSPLPYRPLPKSHLVPPIHCEHDPWYRGYPPPYSSSGEYPTQDYDARYHSGVPPGIPPTHHQQSREYYPAVTSERSSRSQGQPYTVSMDENSPRVDYGLSSPTRSRGDSANASSGLSHPPPPAPTLSSAGPLPPRYSQDHYDSSAAAAQHHHQPVVQSSSSFYQESYYQGVMTHPHPPHAPHLRMDEPYEPHPHHVLPREYATPPPPPSYDHHPTSASWDVQVPKAVSQEGERKHQFRKGARGVHSEPVLLRKKFSWRNYPEVWKDDFNRGRCSCSLY